MMSVSTSYEQSGRTRQKQRTRDALVAAARELVAREGGAPTVEEAAAAAGVSRTTAYRYFPSQRDLLVAAHPEVEAESMLPRDVGDDPETRLAAAVRAFLALILDTEAQQRTMLRLSLDPVSPPDRTPLRKGRAIHWFEEALEPARDRLTDEGVHRLAIAVRSAVGIESLVWLVDVAGLSRDEAARVMESNARAVVRWALAGDAVEGRAGFRGSSGERDSAS